MRCVTSFVKEGYRLYGPRFLETYIEHVGVPLEIYIEEEDDYPQHELFTYKQLFKVPGCLKYLETVGSMPACRGHAWGDDKYNYRFDTFRFCRKSFAQVAAASHSPDGWMYWLDADIEFTGRFVFPRRNAFMLYLGRPDWHSCASFIGWDLTHPISGKFFEMYWKAHITGTILALPEWTDCHVLDFLREQMNLPCVNLAAGLEEQLEGPANVFDVVFRNAHHKKGNLKFANNERVQVSERRSA